MANLIARVAARSSPTPFAGGVGRDSSPGGIASSRLGAGQPYPPVRGPAGLPITGPGSTRLLELKSPGACTCGPAVNWDVAQDDRVLGVAPLGQLVAAGVGVGSL